MRKALRWIGIVVLALAIAFVAFYFWASSPIYDGEEYASIRSYDGEATLRDTIRVGTYNIGYLSGMVNNRPVRESEAFYANNLASARELLTRMSADIIGFQEIDFGSRRSYDFQQMDSLAGTNDYVAGAMAVNWDARYVPFPYGLPRVNFGRILSGQAILSRIPIERHERIILEMPPHPFWYNAFYLDRLAQIAYLNTQPQIAVINVHLEAFHRETREQQAETLLQIVDSLSTDHAVFLIGDFNAEAPASFGRSSASMDAMDTERTMEALAQHPILEAVYSVGLLDPADAKTFPADAPAVKIDHILYDVRYFRPVHAAVLDAEGPPSDHRPVMADFVRVEGEVERRQ